MRAVGKVVVGAAVVVLVGGAGFGAYNLYAGVTGGNTASTHGGAVTGTEVRDTARRFLNAWADGNDLLASGFTNDAQAAVGLLGGFRDDAKVKKVTLTPGAAQGATVPFRVKAEIRYGKTRSTWRYDSQLTVVRGRTTDKPLVDWTPAVVHPKLARGQTVRTELAENAPVTVLDRDGEELRPGRYPSLDPLLTSLRARYGDRMGGTGQVEVWAVRPDGTAGDTLHVVTKGKRGTLRTTLDAAVQKSAEKAVAKRSGASVVALKPSTGEILAVANSDRGEFNAALQGQTAPGSTFKIISAATLLETGTVTPGKKVPCPKTAAYQQGMTFHNVEDSENPGATFAQDFAASCNTAFVTLAGAIPDGALAREAQSVFGIGRDWQVGVSTFDGAVSDGGGDDKAAALIGQGTVQMNPLTMASVAATAQTGRFRQPVLVSRSVGHRDVATSDRGLSPAVVQQLKGMMRLTATSGTAARAMSGLSGDIGAKTGSAEIDGQPETNAWFTAYRNDMAAAAVVTKGGHGGDAAGPVVREVLTAH
ncbi:penicillin-binding transpeptidase domain-containing protein [Streptomyces sp. NEAU-Y11]|uniref:penicillin-binding transpeptidase domain-containing protein n=1 Tax=Streptomyces cucumeris TaxID=2962890 RepID=UPI0020C85FC6|nr:penicillin-binding transpeptidase domain-containing protein [Streptomyces sp. NEAU-Y11]MCP9207938.1 penicillin-binding transpeptidase domain-containing protein [Streptomyces sp. NEAU-Y11]